MDFEEVKAWVRSGHIVRRLLRYDIVRLHVERVDTMPKPLATAAVVRSLSRGECSVMDGRGTVAPITLAIVRRHLRAWFRDRRGTPDVLRTVESDLAVLEDMASGHGEARLNARAIYIRSDLAFGLEAGGSVGHIAGVLNNLDSFVGRPLFLTTDSIPTVDAKVETTILDPMARFWDFRDVPELASNQQVIAAATTMTHALDVSFVYQRYSVYNYAGAALARARGVPLVLEYNGSEVWINRHWGQGLKYEALAERIEMLNLVAAALVVVVSDAMREELEDRGIPATKILVNPNGVDPDRYSPRVDGQDVRDELALGANYVIGFIGTFGRWHGAENLAYAFNRLMERRRDLRDRVRLLMIGDGVGLPATRAIVDNGGYASRVAFTGRVRQELGPKYLAACDMLVSPHVPNPDGSRFFGSPTKLFEYMAMGKPIVASGLEQIDDVLEDGRTAVVVEPGNVEALADGMARVIDSPELAARLGVEARLQAVQQHTWREHTRRIVARLEELCA